uniref:Uncharacterized protein n=1 Tax=Zonotrichia albicollis TaxID=44394 RepID=A0A8D2M0D0_ZONAL
MKILFLLLPLILLLVHGAAGEKGRREMGESVSTQLRSCPPGTHHAGRCSVSLFCCRR